MASHDLEATTNRLRIKLKIRHCNMNQAGRVAAWLLCPWARHLTGYLYNFE